MLSFPPAAVPVAEEAPASPRGELPRLPDPLEGLRLAHAHSNCRRETAAARELLALMEELATCEGPLAQEAASAWEKRLRSLSSRRLPEPLAAAFDLEEQIRRLL